MIRLDQLSLQYSGEEHPLLHDLSITIHKGETVLVCGPTGCGKSSLINCMNGVLHHESTAQIRGNVYLDDRDIRTLPLANLCTWAGTVFQNPDTQICTATPETEIAFGLENQCLDRVEMRKRINEALDYTGLSHCRHQSASTLSGGQKQRLVIACALALKPKILFLDEPVSQLDPKGAEEILLLINRLKAEHAYTIVLIEHRIDETFGIADRVVIMDRGGIVSDGTPEESIINISAMRALGIKLPHLPDYFDRISRPERPLLPERAPVVDVKQESAYTPDVKTECMCIIDNVTFGYSKEKVILNDLSLHLYRGEHIALMGTNGAGKSTLLHLLANARKPVSGKIRWADSAVEKGLVLQSPDLMLFCETVRDECLFAPIHQERGHEEANVLVDTLMEGLGLYHLADSAPFALSKGQRLRVAVASVLSKQPSVLLLDEPTTGQDREHIDKLMCHIENEFDLVVFCTHDVDTAARHANRIVLLHDGTIIADGTPDKVFHNHNALAQASLRQTTIQQYAARLGVRALCVEELVSMTEGKDKRRKIEEENHVALTSSSVLL